MQMNSGFIFLMLVAGCIVIILLTRVILKNDKVAGYLQQKALGINESSSPVEIAIAEADFHLRYDLKEQALEIINEALKLYPDNQSLLLKQSEIENSQ